MKTATHKNIAIIGTGISGLGAAYLLHPQHQITVYEKNAYIGGHSRTVEVKTADGVIPVDTGFIVFNHRNYPLLTGLFAHLKVPTAKSDMSFGVSINNGAIEYGTRHLTDIFAQKRNLLRPAFWRMVADILRFNKQAAGYLHADPRLTLGECLEKLQMGEWFRDYYLLAMGGAIWSTPVSEMLRFPATTFIRFFENHGLLTVSDQPQWHTVVGGSREYVQRLSAPFKDNIRPNCGAVKVIREAEGVTVVDTQGGRAQYDEVVFACHADQALAMIENPAAEEQRILAAFTYQPNRAVLHRDLRFMPKRKKAWASWVYLSETEKDGAIIPLPLVGGVRGGCLDISKVSVFDEQHPLPSPPPQAVEGVKSAVSLSYWMNNLQPLATAQPLIVTLNPGREPDPALVYEDHWFEHPLFDSAAIRAQEEIPAIQGKNRLWFCGAYQRYGFHEDGLGSAVAMAQMMGIEKPWKSTEVPLPPAGGVRGGCLDISKVSVFDEQHPHPSPPPQAGEGAFREKR